MKKTHLRPRPWRAWARNRPVEKFKWSREVSTPLTEVPHLGPCVFYLFEMNSMNGKGKLVTTEYRFVTSRSTPRAQVARSLLNTRKHLRQMHWCRVRDSLKRGW